MISSILGAVVLGTAALYAAREYDENITILTLSGVGIFAAAGWALGWIAFLLGLAILVNDRFDLNGADEILDKVVWRGK